MTASQPLAPADPAPQRTLLDSRKEVGPAVRQIIGLATRLVRCAHHDLEPFGLSLAATVHALERFVLAHRSARIRLLVDDPHWLQRDAARLRLLQRRFSHAVEMRVASSDDAVGEDCLLLADDRHLLSLRGATLGVGEVWINNEPHAQPLVAAFDRRWAAGAHNLPVDALGL